MARIARIKMMETGVRYYHLMSRTNNKEFLFKSPEVKDALMAVVKRTAAFCGVKVDTCAIMSNHFHILARVERSDTPVEEAELIRRVGILRGEPRAEALALRWKSLAMAGRSSDVDAEQAKLRRRMNDISEFMKLFKEEVSRYYKNHHDYCGTIWSGRFTSTLVESGRYLSYCRKYIMLNPVRAGIVTRVSDYRWCWSALGRFENLGTHPEDAGSVPEDWGKRRIAQIGAGKVFGSEEFVRQISISCGSKFPAKHVGVHPVGAMGYSTHGWKLAQALEAKQGIVAA